MYKVQDFLIDSSGNAVSGATVTVRVANATPHTGVVAAIYSDDGITLRANPTTTASDGYWFFYAADGNYDIHFSYASSTAELTNFKIADVDSTFSTDVNWNVRDLDVSTEFQLPTAAPGSPAAGDLWEASGVLKHGASSKTVADLETEQTFTAAQSVVAPASAGKVALTAKGNATANADVLDIYDSAGSPAKQSWFDANGIFGTNGNITFKSGTSFTATLDHGITADRTIVLPDASATLATTATPGTSGSDVNWSATGVLNVPDAGGATRGVVSTGSQTFAGLKTFTNGITVPDATLTIQDNGDATKQLQFQASGISTGTTRTLTAPNLSGTVMLTDQTQTATGDITFSGDIRVKDLNAVRFADQFAGADFAAKVAAAIADLPSTGGTVDCRGLEGAQTASTDPLSGNTKTVTLLLGGTTITSSVGWGSSSSGTVRILGKGHWGGDPTTISFSGATTGITCGSDGWELADLIIDGNGSSSTYGLVLGGASSRSLFTGRNLTIKDFQRGLSMTAVSIDNNFFNCNFLDNSAYGIYIAGTTGTANFPTTTRFIGGRVQNNTTAGAYVGLSRGMIFDKFLFNDNPGDGLQLGVTAAESAEDVSVTQCWFEENGTAPAGTNFDIKAQRVMALSIKDTNFGSALATPLRVYRNANLAANDAERVMVEGGQFLSANPVILDSTVQGVQLINTGLLEGSLLTDNAADTLVLERNMIRKGGASTLKTILTTDKYGILTLDTGNTANAQGINFSKTAAGLTGPMGAVRARATNYGVDGASMLEFATNSGVEATPSVRMTLSSAGALAVSGNGTFSKDTDTRVTVADLGTAGARSSGIDFYGDMGAGQVKTGDIVVSHNGGTMTLGSQHSGITSLVLRAANANQVTIGNATMTVSGSLSYRHLAEVVSAANVITAAESGSVFFLNSGTEFDSVLPAPSLGLHYTFIVTAAPAGASYTITTNSGANIIKGQIYTVDVNSATDPDFETGGLDVITFVDGLAVAGDRVDVYCDGSNWFAYGFCSVYNAITIS